MLAEAEELAGTVDAGDVTGRQCAGNGLLGDLDFRTRIESGGYDLRQFKHTNVMVGPDVDGCESGGMKEDCPEPNREVAGVEIGSSGRTIAMNVDWPACEDVADEVANGEVLVEREMGTAEGPAAGNLTIKASISLIKSAKELGYAFALSVDAGRKQRVGGALIGFGHVGHIGRLPAIDRA